MNINRLKFLEVYAVVRRSDSPTLDTMVAFINPYEITSFQQVNDYIEVRMRDGREYWIQDNIGTFQRKLNKVVEENTSIVLMN